MPDPIVSVAIVKALAGPAIKALITGRSPEPDEWAKATTSILDALLERQNDMSDTLQSIDKKVDELIGQNFRSAFGAGHYLLTEARSADTDEERLTDLREARKRFIEALQLADTQSEPSVTGAWVNWHLAITYLLMGNRSKCLNALVEARDSVAGELLAAIAECSQISP
jgi:hypothetical protein